MSWWLWVLVGIALLVVEVATPGGFFALFFGVGALFVAVLAALEVPATVQWISFSILSVAGLLVLRSPLRRRLERSRPAQGDVVGEHAVLLEDLPPGGEAKAELRGTPWTARSSSTLPLAKGQRCIVERLDGLTLWLRAE
jgi:membrane protein implicated in regulation of membrane protease activity